MNGDTRVTYREADGKWAVEVEGAAWACSRHHEKVRAERAGESVAREQRAELLVLGRDGRVTKRVCYKGNDRQAATPDDGSGR